MRSASTPRLAQLAILAACLPSFRVRFQVSPSPRDARYQLGITAMTMKQAPAAYRVLTTAEKPDEGKQPSSVDIRLRLGLLLLEPGNPSHADTLGWLFYGMGSWLASLAAAVKQDPQFGQDAELRRAVTEIEERKAQAEAAAKRARRMR